MTLKTCPFCGGNAQMSKRWDSDGDHTWAYVYCKKCKVETSGKWYTGNNDCPIFYEEVRDQWNTRIDEMINSTYNEIIDRLTEELALAKDKIAKLESLQNAVKKFDTDLCKEKHAIFPTDLYCKVQDQLRNCE